MSKGSIVISANTAWYIANFRLSLAAVLKREGYRIYAVAPEAEDRERITDAGIEFIPVAIDSTGTNILRETAYLFRLARVLREIKPSFYLGYTVKPNIYGGIACSFLGIPYILNISGLGKAFVSDTMLSRIIGYMYKAAVKKSARVFFQNTDDLELFLRKGIVSEEMTDLLPGSGVDTSRYSVQDSWESSSREKLSFLFVGRLLWEKGIGEFVDAARLLQNQNIEFQVLGFATSDEADGATVDRIEMWQKEGLIRYLGAVEDVRPMLQNADCVVLPSYYREGVPRSLLEAASMGKPVITTDSVGCRECVEAGETGLLCEPRNVEDLRDKMLAIFHMTPDERKAMGRKGRAKMENEFSESIVLEKYLKTVRELSAISH